jgi:4-hydroxy-2-oxoheptanedioate aldolase
MSFVLVGQVTKAAARPRDVIACSAFSSRVVGVGAFGGPAHAQRSNDGVALAVMIETFEGVVKAAAIAAVPGLAADFVGPNDLAHNMGCENRWNEAPVQAAVARTLHTGSEAGKCPGIQALTPEDEDRDAAWGARYFATVSAASVFKALKVAAPGG